MKDKKFSLAITLAAVGLAIMAACSGSETAGKNQEEVGKVRKPAVAGTFYPRQPGELRQMVDEFLKNAKPPVIDGKVLCVISPHAGYVYSGQVAAYCYSAIKDGDYDVVVLVGPSHRMPVGAAAVYTSGGFETPLGGVEVDQKTAGAIVSSSREFEDDPGVHAVEHSLEVQLPFLQRALGDFKIVPILTRDISPAACQALGEALAGCLRDKKVLLVASTDLSHYPSYSDANKVDKETIQSWETMDLAKIYAKEAEILQRGVRNLSCTMCGGSAVMIVMAAAKALGADGLSVLKYMNSGAVSGDRSGVVGYAAAAIYKNSSSKGKPGEQSSGRESAQPGELGRSERKKLLQIARNSIAAALQKEDLPDFGVTESSLKGHQGAFVTLHKGGQLRGCIGRFVADEPLFQVVSKMAVAAATQDHRFPPVRLSELQDIEVEISVLSPLWKMTGIDELELGKHGIYVVKGMRSGCYLPQVADETGWSKEDFLTHCCTDKAGLESDAWKEGADVYLFTAEVFSEKEVR